MAAMAPTIEMNGELEQGRVLRSPTRRDSEVAMAHGSATKAANDRQASASRQQSSLTRKRVSVYANHHVGSASSNCQLEPQASAVA